MPKYCKIPHFLKGEAIASGHYCVFGNLLEVGPAFIALVKKDKATGIPAHGIIQVKGKKYYYCRYGFVSDPDIYTKPVNPKLKRKRGDQ